MNLLKSPIRMNIVQHSHDIVRAMYNIVLASCKFRTNILEILRRIIQHHMGVSQCHTRLTQVSYDIVQKIAVCTTYRPDLLNIMPNHETVWKSHENRVNLCSDHTKILWYCIMPVMMSIHCANIPQCCGSIVWRHYLIARCLANLRTKISIMLHHRWILNIFKNDLLLWEGLKFCKTHSIFTWGHCQVLISLSCVCHQSIAGAVGAAKT